MTVADTLPLTLTPPPGGQILHTSGHATVIWGDCRDPAVVAAGPDGYGLLCTDPPYGVNYRSNYGRNFNCLEGDDGSVNWPDILAEWVGPEGTPRTRGLMKSRHVYVFGYRPEQLAGPLRLGGTAELMWDKVIQGSGDVTSPWGPSHETLTFGVHRKDACDRAQGRGQLSARLRRGSVLRYPRPSGSAMRHPTEKPWQLMADLIESSTLRGDVVVDPCAGSGSTGVAAVLEGRRAFLVEFDRKFAELTVQRVKAAERIAAQIAAA